MITGKRTAACAALAALLFLPVVAAAEQEGEEWKSSMEDRMRVLEDQLKASQATIDAQQQVMQAHGVNPDVSQGSVLDEFFNSLEWGGHVESTYTYNFNDPDTQLAAQPLWQFGRDHQTFQLNAVKLELGKATDEPGTAGFQIDLLWGDNAEILGAYGGVVGNADDFSHVQEAYIAYNWENIVFKMGKFETLLGYEVIDSPDNFHVSHGLLFTWAIPLVHTGLLASGNFTEEVGWAIGATNGYNNVTDTNDNKGALGQLSFESGPLFTSLSAYYGADGGTPRGNTASVSANPAATGCAVVGTTTDGSCAPNNHDDIMIIDAIAQFVPQEGTTLYVNADYGEQQDVIFPTGHGNPRAGASGDTDSYYYGVALGAHHQFTEKVDGAVRGEYFYDDEGYKLPVNDEEAEAYSLTGTLGVQLTENLKTRFEGRYDRLNSDGPFNSSFSDILPAGGRTTAPTAEDDSLTAIWEVVYEFD